MEPKIGLYVESYQPWMQQYTKPFASQCIVTNLPSGGKENIITDNNFDHYPLEQIVYYLGNPQTVLERIKHDLSHHPLATIQGFGKTSSGDTFVMHHDQLMKLIPEVPTIDTSNHYMAPNGVKLRPYQNQMVDFALAKKRCGLFVDMGLGKTLATLVTIDQLLQRNALGTKKPILVVAPKMVALDTWSREAQKWGYDWNVLVNIGLNVSKRNALLEQALPQNLTKPTLLTTNPEQLENIRKFFIDKGIHYPFDLIVIDELSLFKSPSTKRFTLMEQLSKASEYFIGLTGTPAPNNLLDIWSQSMIISQHYGKSLGQNFYAYRSRYFEPDMVNKRDGTVYSWKTVSGAEKVIYNHLKSNIISMKTDGRIQLPEVSYSNEYVTLPPKAFKEYKKWEYDVKTFLSDGNSATIEVGDNNVAVANTAVLKSKLIQLAGGAVYDNLLSTDPTEVPSYTVFHNEKLKRLKEIVETATSPLLVFYQFKSDIERAKKLIEFEALDPNDPNIQQTITRWNKGEIPVLFAHPASTGHGLNLQDGGHTIIWLTATWSNEQYRQANKRLHRSGQTQPVQIIHLVAKGTADEELIERLGQKEYRQQALMEALEVK